jgi:hypothetical protein
LTRKSDSISCHRPSLVGTGVVKMKIQKADHLPLRRGSWAKPVRFGIVWYAMVVLICSATLMIVPDRLTIRNEHQAVGHRTMTISLSDPNVKHHVQASPPTGSCKNRPSSRLNPQQAHCCVLIGPSRCSMLGPFHPCVYAALPSVSFASLQAKEPGSPPSSSWR